MADSNLRMGSGGGGGGSGVDKDLGHMKINIQQSRIQYHIELTMYFKIIYFFKVLKESKKGWIFL